MDTQTRLYASTLRLYALGLKLLRIDAAARAAGREPGPKFDALVKDARAAAWDLHDWTNGAVARREARLARERFSARYPRG